MKAFFFISIFLMNIAYAKVNVSLSTQNPVKEESFNIIFEIDVEGDVEPEISFDPDGLEIIGKSNAGVSTRTTYINGKLATEKKVTVSYEVVAPRARITYLRNILVKTGGEDFKHNLMKIRILSQPIAPRDVFALAEVDKTEVFVGESIIVRYYLYNKVPVHSTEIRKFPKLDKFLKRYHQEKVVPERVSYNNQIYTRRVMYTAQLYATEAGNYSIDPITFGVRYSRDRGGIGSFGLNLGLGRTRSKTLTSKKIEIKAKALPVDNVPPSFTGLVGEHTFNLKINKSKFITNEPIELTLTVNGPGALELFESPTIISSPAIEEFESNADLLVDKDFNARKTFNYTYLGRENSTLKEQRLPFTIFNPKTLKYETVELQLGPIEIAGGNRLIPSETGVGKNEPKQDTYKSESSSLHQVPESKLEFIYKPLSSFIYHAQTIIIALLAILLITILSFFIKYILRKERKELPLFDEITQIGLSYSNLLDLGEVIAGRKCSLVQALEERSYKGEALDYFKDISEKLDEAYKKDGNVTRIKVDKKKIKELQKLTNDRDTESL